MTNKSPKSKPQNATLQCQLPDDCRVIVAGLGGIGGLLLAPLVMFLHSLNVPLRLLLVDGDSYEPKNSDRQSFQSVGNKAEVKAKETIQLLGSSGITIVPLPEYLQPDNISARIKPGDFIFLCVDNHPTRKLVSDHLATLSDAVLISGGNDGIKPPDQRGTYGNVQVAVRRDGKNVTVPITRYHPEITASKEPMPHELSCGQLVPSAPQILFTNFAVASAMLGAFFAICCARLNYQEVKLDILEARMLPQFPLAAS